MSFRNAPRSITRYAAIAAAVAVVVPAMLGPTVAHAAPAPSTDSVPPVAWQPCGEALAAFECGTYTVPRDYAAPDGPTIDLALTRLPASNPEARIGSLFLNPGGPGGSGVALAQSAGPFLSALTDGRFDIVGFDPRGVAASTPVTCFTGTVEAIASRLIPSDLPDTPDEVAEVTTATGAYTQLCGARNPELLPYLSTEFVARDLDRLRAAVGDEQLSYLGYSYGTALGATYANLFPERVRALALDGVVNPQDYTADITTALAGSLRDAESVLDGFFSTCEDAGPDLCALAGKDPRAVYDNLLGDVREKGGYPALGGTAPGVIRDDDITGLVFTLLYLPVTWPQLAAAIDTASTTGDGTAFTELAAALVGPQSAETPYNNAGDARSAIWCTDTGDDGTVAEWPDRIDRLRSTSPSFGAFLGYTVGLPCVTWPAQAASRYAGPWDAHTANPVLLLSSTYDPITPLASARELNALLPDSRLLVQNSYGHTTAAPGQASTCTFGFLRAYLLDQTLPAEGTVCDSDTTPFGQPTAGRSGQPGGSGADTLPGDVPGLPGGDDFMKEMIEQQTPAT